MNVLHFIDILEVDTEDYEDIGKIQNERLWWKANPIRMSYENGRDKIRGLSVVHLVTITICKNMRKS